MTKKNKYMTMERKKNKKQRGEKNENGDRK